MCYNTVSNIPTIFSFEVINVGKRKFYINSNDVINFYLSGISIKDIACKYGSSEHVIRDILHKSNISTARKFPTDNLSVDKVLELYNQGIGVAGIAERLGYTRTSMIGFFNRNHIPKRNPREQQIERMKYSTPEQIAHLTESAHKATKGRKVSVEEREYNALMRFVKQDLSKMSKYELILSDILKSRNISFVTQYPIGTYNVDFLVGNVIVEIFGGEWHRTGEHRRRFAERTKYILNQGFVMLFVFAYDTESFKTVVTDYVIPNIQELSTDKSFIGQYRMIWSNGKHITTGCSDTVNQALVSPSINLRNLSNGRYESVTKNTVAVLR